MTDKVWPTRIKLTLLKLFQLLISLTDTPYAAAIFATVSPDFTVYVPVVVFVVVETEVEVAVVELVPPTVNVWPTIIKFGFEMPFVFTRFATVVWYVAAILFRVSPTFTVCVVVLVVAV